jgi:hypothetical protein
MECSPSAQRASDFDSEGREFESLRERQHLGLQIKGFLQNSVLRPVSTKTL